MPGADEEAWYSQLQAAQLTERLGRTFGEVLEAYLKAYQCRPTRPETLGCLARYCRLAGHFHLARLFAKQAMETPPTRDLLFEDPMFSRWLNLDEYAVACYWTGHFRESEIACLRLLQEGQLPEPERARVEANLAAARSAIAE